jgi:predicted nucleic acid-binding protein
VTLFLLGERRALFIDTSAFYAALDRREGNHADAASVFDRVARERIVPYTSNFIVAECHALIVSRLGTRAGLDFIDMIERGTMEVVSVSLEDEERARVILRQYQDKTFSYTDATCFAVMERLGLRDAFSFDGDFSQYGFRTLPDA